MDIQVISTCEGAAPHNDAISEKQMRPIEAALFAIGSSGVC
jgi:hypothetical protein